jgi:lipopolysaccharide export LptBFGC system permease protein LptF
VGITILVIAAISFSALSFIFRDGRIHYLLPLGAIAIAAFIAQAILRKFGRQTRMLSQAPLLFPNPMLLAIIGLWQLRALETGEIPASRG